MGSQFMMRVGRPLWFVCLINPGWIRPYNDAMHRLIWFTCLSPHNWNNSERKQKETLLRFYWINLGRQSMTVDNDSFNTQQSDFMLCTLLILIYHSINYACTDNNWQFGSELSNSNLSNYTLRKQLYECKVILGICRVILNWQLH